MAPNTNGPIWELVPTLSGVQFTNADTTTKKILQTGGADGTRIDSIMCSSNDSAAVNLAFYVNDGIADYYIGNVLVPAGSGYTTVARVEALAILAPLTGYLVLPPTCAIKLNCVATMTAARIADIVAMGGHF